MGQSDLQDFHRAKAKVGLGSTDASGHRTAV